MPYKPYHTTLPGLTSENWRQKCAEKREERQSKIPKEWLLTSPPPDSQLDVTGIPASCGILDDSELEITEIDDADQLLADIKNRKYSSVQVTSAICKRAAIAQQLVNCLTEIFFDRALKRAQELDQYLEKHGKSIGPLHGLPVSLKDQFDIQGIELNMGYASYLGRISEKDAALVRLLHDAGAILYARTNIPQTLMLGDANNHVYGRTVNPRNRKLIPGGSSGGEGALIALKGSIVGVGTDIGGSIRIPASMNGLYGLRPSTRRVPYGDATNSMPGQNTIRSVAGPLARSLSTIRTFMAALSDMQPSNYDASVLPMPFSQQSQDEAYSRKQLCFGILKTDGFITPHPPVQRALTLVQQTLEKAGHKVIEFCPPELARTRTLAADIYVADGGEDFARVLGPIREPFIEGLGFVADEDAPKPSVYDSWQLQREKEDMQQSFLKQWLDTEKQTETGRCIDAWIGPVDPSTACLPNANTEYNYTVIANVLDLPSVVVPITTVDPAVDTVSSDFKPRDEADAKLQSRYDPQLTAGMPVCLQIMGRRWRDEEVLAVAMRVDEIMHSTE